MRHREGLDGGCADQHAPGERRDRKALCRRERLVALPQPPGRPERETRPLERQLRDVGQEGRTVGTKRHPDRQDVDGDAPSQQRVGQPAYGTLTVRTRRPQQRWPSGNREVVGCERSDAAQTRRWRLVRLKSQAQQLADRASQRLHDRDDECGDERRSPDCAVGLQPRAP
jgi:hypothetical protein